MRRHWPRDGKLLASHKITPSDLITQQECEHAGEARGQQDDHRPTPRPPATMMVTGGMTFVSLSSGRAGRAGDTIVAPCDKGRSMAGRTMLAADRPRARTIRTQALYGTKCHPRWPAPILSRAWLGFKHGNIERVGDEAGLTLEKTNSGDIHHHPAA